MNFSSTSSAAPKMYLRNILETKTHIRINIDADIKARDILCVNPLAIRLRHKRSSCDDEIDTDMFIAVNTVIMKRIYGKTG